MGDNIVNLYLSTILWHGIRLILGISIISRGKLSYDYNLITNICQSHANDMYTHKFW